MNVQEVSVAKWIDSTSPKRMQACCNGTHYATALLTSFTTGRPGIRARGGGSAGCHEKLTIQSVDFRRQRLKCKKHGLSGREWKRQVVLADGVRNLAHLVLATSL